MLADIDCCDIFAAALKGKISNGDQISSASARCEWSYCYTAMNSPEASRWLIKQQYQVDGLLSARKLDKLGFLILALVGPALSPAWGGWVDQQVSRTWFYGSNPKSSTRYLNIHVAGKRARRGRITFPSTNCKKEERSRLQSLAAADCENQTDQQDQESANPLI